MSNILWKSLIVSPAILGATILVSTTAIAAPNVTTEVPTIEKTVAVETVQPEVVAQAAPSNTEKTVAVETVQPEVVAKAVPSNTEKTVAVETVQPKVVAQAAPSNNDSKVIDQVNTYSNEGRTNNSLSQVTSVSQFSDVQPTDWAFQALQSLVERYGCIAGYPNGTYRGNRALTRYEFAAGLNACLDRVNELIATATADLVTKQDLATLQRLQEEFSAELATLRGRVDALEARSAELEANQFSTTTKLVGEAIFAVTDVFGDRTGDNNNTVFQNRVRLGLQSSFTGRDILTTRLSIGNATPFALADNAGNPISTAETLQTFNVGSTGNNSVRLDRLTYEVPVGPAQVYIAAAGGKHSHYTAVNNPYFFDKTDGGNGALSTLSSENPIYRIGGGAGIAFNVPFGKGGSIIKPSSFTIGYLASEANSPSSGQGLFNGNYAALGQVNFGIGDRVAVAATYVHGYHGAGSALFDGGEQGNLGTGVVGTNLGNLAGGRNRLTGTESAYNSNSYGLSAAFRPSDKLSISGFVSYSDVAGFGANDNAEVWSYGVGIALPDFGKRGNVLGVFAGAQPYALGLQRGSNNVPYQVEGFYKYRVSNNISITPGVIWLTSPGQSNDNSDAFIGTLRTTFTF